MTIKVGIEPTLTPIKDYLIEKGYEVKSINYGIKGDISKYQQFDAIVVTGMNENFAGMEDTVTNAVVINASGLTPPEVEKEIRERTNLQ